MAEGLDRNGLFMMVMVVFVATAVSTLLPFPFSGLHPLTVSRTLQHKATIHL
jgi:hypothetical protein